MGHIDAIDVSQWQGNINWSAVPQPIAILKMSGGDAGLYVDSKANQNYYGAKAAGKLIGGYHFAGGGDPANEADFFVAAMSPLEENDVLVLDWEIEHPDPVGWCTTFVNRVHERTGTWPLFYTNGSRLNQYDWSPVRNNCGTWVAWYGMDPEGSLPVSGMYVMHQYTSDGSVPGIAGRVDLDAWFGTLDQFKMYGWHSTQPVPEPTPEPEPVPPPNPIPDPPTPEPVPEPEPEPIPEPTPEPPVPQPKPEPNWKGIATGLLTAIVAAVLAVVAWISKH
jgi:lysozyme